MHPQLDKADGEGVRNFCQTLMGLASGDHEMQLAIQQLCKIAENGLRIQHYLNIPENEANRQLEEAHQRIRTLEAKEAVAEFDVHHKRLSALEPALVDIHKIVDLYQASQMVSRANLVLKLQKVRDITRPLLLPTRLNRGQRVETKNRY